MSQTHTEQQKKCSERKLCKWKINSKKRIKKEKR